MTRVIVSVSVSALLAGPLAACALPAPGADGGAVDAAAEPDADVAAASGREAPFQLRVSLYPYIPEPDSFLAWIESDFESRNPDIDLIVRPLARSYEWEPEYVADLAYEPERTAAALADAASPDHQHLVELDTLILGWLAERGAIAPFDVPGARYLPAAAEAVTWNGQRVGVAHWTCGNFVISEDPAVRSARDADALVATLAAAGTPRVDLAGDLAGSWNAISTYLDAYRDTYPRADLGAALARPALDPAVMAQLAAIGAACTKDGVSQCGSDAVDLFATGGADALVGFSERLHPILAHPGRAVGALHVASAPLGGGDHPAAFVDALVLSPVCEGRCRRAARRFAAYYVSDATFEVALMALDTAAGVPRYLLPSTASSLEHGLVAEDELYRQLAREIRRSRAYPTSGVPEARAAGAVRAQVEAALGL